MKKRWKCSDSKVVKGMLVTACAILFFMGQKNISYAQMTGKITAGSARIRQQADKDSVALGSVAQGTTVTIVNDVTDSAGTRWFEVSVDGTSGFIRADLVSEEASSAAAEAPQTSAAGAETGAETPMDAQYATVTVPTAKVRSTPSTNSGTVDGLPSGTQVIVSGQSNGSDNRVWYYVNYTNASGEGKTGFIRSDLLELGEMVPVEAPPEETQPEETAPEQQPEAQPEHMDYEVVYDEGEGVWYLYDWTGEGTYQNLQDVIAAAHAQNQNTEQDAKTISKQRVVIIVLIAILIILAVVLTIMIFKLRDAYYEAYEDDDEDEDDDEEEEEEPPVRRREESGRRREEPSRRREEPVRRREEREEPVRRKSAPRDEQQPVRKKTSSSGKSASSREASSERDAAPAKPAPKKKAKNFMADEDEFEFEFLNMKDKDR